MYSNDFLYTLKVGKDVFLETTSEKKLQATLDMFNNLEVKDVTVIKEFFGVDPCYTAIYTQPEDVSKDTPTKEYKYM